MSFPVIESLFVYVPPFLVLAFAVVGLLILNYFLRRGQAEMSVARQFVMLALTAIAVLVFVFWLPVTETGRGQILSLIGIVVTAVIALSSTSFVANIMAGLMLRAVNSFRPGDFIRCEAYFGRVTERGIFHIEIQTEDRDLATIPNMYLVTNPVTVVHESGTIISAYVSLGYDISHVQIEALLIEAAEKTGLTDAFVLVGELGDFSVSYRVGGFSDDVGHLLSIKSSLRKNILSVVHENGVEIVSPNFMNQRVLQPDRQIIPRDYHEQPGPVQESSIEEVIFDKADSAAEKEAMKTALTDARAELARVEDALGGGSGEGSETLERERDRLKLVIVELAERISGELE